jgi:hypothetical protein
MISSTISTSSVVMDLGSVRITSPVAIRDPGARMLGT